MARTERREDLFKDKEDVFLCDPGDQEAFAKSAHELINNISLRNQFIKNCQQIIKKQFHADPKSYQTAYRESIEQALFVGEDTI